VSKIEEFKGSKKGTNHKNAFIPERLRQVRIALGYSTIDFSEDIGVTRQALNQFETNRITPSYETLLKIEKTTNFPVDYFFKPILPVNDGPFLFRANRTSLKKTKEFSRFIVQQMKESYDFFSEYLDFTPVNVPLLEFDVNSSLDEIEDIAVALRKHWGLGLGPISHVYRLLENNGIIISQLDKRLDKIDAFSQWKDGRPFVLVGSQEFTACRLRLNAMHEFGHILLHTDAEYEERANKDAEFYDVLESQAFRLAGAFMFPRESFLDELFSTSLPHLIELKQRWGVSLAFIVRRCKELEIISDSKYETLMRQIKKFGKMEPLDDKIEKEQPRALNQAANLLMEHGVKTRQEILSGHKLPRTLAESIIGVEPGFFSEHIPEEKIVEFRSKSQNKAN